MELLDEVVAQAPGLTQPGLQIKARLREVEAAATPDGGEAVEREATRQVVPLRIRPALVGRSGAAAELRPRPSPGGQ